MRSALVIFIFICFAIFDFVKPGNNDGDQILEVRTKFNNFQKKFSRTYKNLTEKEFRFKIFSNNSDFIKLHNNRTAKFKLALNKFSDLVSREFN